MLAKKINFLSRNLQDLEANLIDFGFLPVEAKLLFSHVYGQKKVQLKVKTEAFFKEHFELELPKIKKIQKSSDGTLKLLLELEDHLEIETVLLPFHKRYTLCLSTQVGCAMNCQFCFTGKMGLKRNLTRAEIIGQYILAYSYLKEENISSVKPNIVFMGQGEPLHNATEVLAALKILMEKSGLALGPRQITLSTVGYLPALKNLDLFPPINIALSLHSPFDEERSRIIPLNITSPLRNVLEELDKRPLLNKQFIVYEYIILKGINHGPRHARELEKLFKGKKAILNLIPFNPFPGSDFERPNADEVQEFKRLLVSMKLRVMLRETKGGEMLAACGQLNTTVTLSKNKNGSDQPFL